MRTHDLMLQTTAAGRPEPSRAPHILVVDDDARDRNFIAGMLALTGSVVLKASSALEGIALALAEAPALILMDVAMPGMMGVDAMRALRDDPRTASVPVVALTNGRGAEMVDLIAAGWSGHLQKPVELVTLLAGVARLLRSVRPTGSAIATGRPLAQPDTPPVGPGGVRDVVSHRMTSLPAVA
jgi:CheY-like chemotaxis protein